MKNFQLFFVLLAILTLGIGNAWAEEVTYTITSATSVTATGSYPGNSEAIFANTTNTSDKQELTQGQSMTLKLSGFDGCTITGLTLSMKSAKKNSTGSLSMNVGNVPVATNSNIVDVSTADFVPITPSITEPRVGEGDTIVITISATKFSLFCESFTLTYSMPSSGGEGGDGGETPENPGEGETPELTNKYIIKWHTAVGTSSYITLNEGATITEPLTDPTMEHYRFMGWTDNCQVASNGSDFIAITDFGIATENKDFYAVFAKKEQKTYTLVITPNDFDNNNDEKTSIATASDGSTMDVTWFSSNVTFSSDNMQWTKSRGYIYNTTDLEDIESVTITSSAGTFTTYYGDQEQPEEDTTLGDGKGYFQIKVGKQTGQSDRIEIIFNKTVSDSETPSKYYNYITTCPSSNDPEPVDYTITYNTNGGDAIAPTSGIALPDPLPTPTREHYTFAGWYTDVEFTQTATAGITIDTDITLHAKWEPIMYTIILNPNYPNSLTGIFNDKAGNTINGTLEIPLPSGTASTPLTDFYSSIELEGYAFDAFYTQSEGGTKCVNTGEITGNVTFYAHWKEIHTITWSVNGDKTLITPTTFVEGNPWELPTIDYQCDDKIFMGWTTLPIISEQNEVPASLYTTAAQFPNTTATYYAVFAKEGYGGPIYHKVTDHLDNYAGTYLIVNDDNKVAFNGGLETLDATGNTISVEITDATIPSDDATDNSTFTIVKNQGENNYFIISKSNKYIGRTTNEDELDESTTEEYTNTISIDAGNANIIGSGGAYLRYNATSGQERFRYYQSATYTNQKAITLYKKTNITTYSNYSTSCGEHITITSGSTETFSVNQVINTLTIESGATAELTASEIFVNTLILKSGLNADATNYNTANLYINQTTLHVGNLYLDLTVNNKTYYPFSVPFPVAVNQVDYADSTFANYSTYGTQYLIKRYDGAKRAENGVNKDENWVVVEIGETLQPGEGYIISALTGKDAKPVAIRIPLTFAPEHNVSLSIIAHTGTAAANDPIQKGWNFIAHPYLSKYAGNNINNAPRYVSIPTYNFSAYQQTMLMATTLSPEYPFFVQIGEDTEINFTTEGRRQTPASVRADENNQILNLLFNILLADKAQDQTGIILDNSCTPEYEINADLEKMFGSEFTTSIYTLCQDKRLAFNAMSFENAQSSPIPLGYRAAEAGEYTINLDIIEDASAYEHLYDGIVLYDSATEIQTNLLYADYTFTTDKIQDDTRFSIQFIPKSNAPTNIENIPHYQTTQKIILNNQLYIIHNGQIYNITGQNIR